MISNAFFFIRDKEWQGLKPDNITVALNAVDDLAGEESLLALRGRQAMHRTLERIEESTNAFKKMQTDESASAGKEAKQALAEAKKELEDEVDKIDGRQISR